MNMKFFVCFIAILVSIPYIIEEVKATKFSIINNGAKDGGKSDISQALAKTWKQACESNVASEIVIPKGLFYLSQAKFEGPCKASPITITLKGTLQAHIDPSKIAKGDQWVTFRHIDGLVLTGGGTFDGRGDEAWVQNNCHKTTSCKKLPYNLSFNFLTNSSIGPITTLDSKNFHANVMGCQNVTFRKYTVRAPADSPNTDGIHVARSKKIYIDDSSIQTGDDCISIGDETSDMHITKVSCGPGHGISIGSLGNSPGEKPVSGIYIENCDFMNTEHGIRIKTWPDSHPGDVSDVHVTNIRVQNVGIPIIVDQNYCPWNKCSTKTPSKVKLSKLSFTKISGTATGAVAVKLDCSKAFPCQNVQLTDINIRPNGKAVNAAKSTCANVKPITRGIQIPKLCASS